jgi:hypothetical protein
VEPSASRLKRDGNPSLLTARRQTIPFHEGKQLLHLIRFCLPVDFLQVHELANIRVNNNVPAVVVVAFLLQLRL